MRPPRLVLLAVAVLAMAASSASAASTYRLGMMLSMGRNALRPKPVLYQVFEMAVAELNRTAGLMSNGDSLFAYPLNLTGVTRGAFFRSLDAVSFRTADPPADLVLGPTFSSQATVAAGVLQTSYIPNISPSATAVELSDKALYPYFARTITSNAIEARALAYLCYQMNWKRVGLIATSDGFGSSLVEAFSVSAQGLGVTVTASQAFATGSIDPERILQLVQLVKDSGVWVIALFMTGGDYYAVLKALQALGMDKPPYTLLYTTSIYDARPAGSIGFDIFVDESTAQFRAYSARVAAYTGGVEPDGYETHLLYDATYLGGYALAKLSAIKANCPTYPATPAFTPALPWNICEQYASQPAGALLYQLILNTTFTGVSGLLELDSNGDRLGKFWITNSRNITLNPVRVGVLDLGGANAEVGVSTATFSAQPVFADGTTTIPLDRYRPRPGDAMVMEVNGSFWVLAFGICVLGSWTALILIEQAVWNYGHVPLLHTLAWTAASSTALTVGLWSSLAIGLTAPDFPNLPDNELSYAALNVFVSLLVAWPCCYAAFALMIPTLRPRNVPRTNNSELEGMSRMDTNTATASTLEKSGTQQMDADTAVATIKALNEAKIRAAEERKSNRCVKYTKQAVPWTIASACLMTGVAGVHFLIFQSLELAVDVTVSAGILLGGLLIAFVFGAIALAAFFHFRASRYRWMSAFVMAAAIDGAHFTFLGGATFRYNALEGGHDLKASIIQIIAAVLTCIACFVFIGLNVIRLRLSKDVLDRFLLQAQKKIRALEVVAQHRDHMLTERDTLLQLIATVRPLVRANHPMLMSLIKEYAPKKHVAGDAHGDDVDDIAQDAAGLPAGLVATYSAQPQPAGGGSSQLVHRSITRSGAGGSATNPLGTNTTVTGQRSSVVAGSFQVAVADAPPTPSRGGLELTATRTGGGSGATGSGFGLNNVDSPVMRGSSIQPQFAAAGSGGTPLLANATITATTNPSAATSSGPSGPRYSVSQNASGAKYAVDDGVAIDVLPFAVPEIGAGAYGPAGPAGPESQGRPSTDGKADVGPGGSPKTPVGQLQSGGSGAGSSSPYNRERHDSKDNGAAPRGIGRAMTRAAPTATGLLGSDSHPEHRAVGGATATSVAAAAAAQLPGPTRAASFADVMSNPVCLEIFKDAVAANHNSENVAFLLDVERYRQTADDQDDPAAPEKRRVLALDIVATYFGMPSSMLNAATVTGAPGGPFIPAPHAINIASTVRDAVLDDIRKERFTPKLFDTPFHEVRRLLERNDFARFVESPQYAVCGALLLITSQLQDRLALGAALPRGRAAEILENSILHAKAGKIKSSNLFSGGSSGASNPSSGGTSAQAAEALANSGAAQTPFRQK